MRHREERRQRLWWRRTAVRNSRADRGSLRIHGKQRMNYVELDNLQSCNAMTWISMLDEGLFCTLWQVREAGSRRRSSSPDPTDDSTTDIRRNTRGEVQLERVRAS